jgi:ArsR family transcriptional regulator
MYVPSMLRSITSRPKVALLFHALSDPTRLELLERLKTGEQCVCDLTDIMHTGQSRLSFHLKVLKEAGLIVDRREGRWMYYSLNPGAIEELEELVVALKQSAKSAASAGRCC